MTPWQKHVERWKNCTGCEYSKCRQQVVLARGSIPCDVLFVGEAPGASEDALGKPFIGPAGKLLDDIIRQAWCDLEDEISCAFTNLVACIPLDDGVSKYSEPSKESIQACTTRLVEFVELCQPKRVVAVGKLAEKYLGAREVHDIGIVHPAAIMRADVSQQGLAIKQCVLALRDLAEGLIKDAHIN